MKDRSSPKKPRAGSAYAKNIEGDWPAQEALSRAREKLKAFGVALRHTEKAAKVSDILLASLTEATAAIREKPGFALAEVVEAQQAVITDFAAMLAEIVAEAREESRADGQKFHQKALAELDQAQQEYERQWQEQTGLTPPRFDTIEELEQAIDWWKEQAAFVDISPERILDAGERVQHQFEPIIKGRLRLLRLQATAVTAKEFSNQLPKKEADWHDVQTKLLNLRNEGQPYTSQRDLAARLNCSESTVNKAIKNSGILKGWMARHTKYSPKAQSLNEVVTDGRESLREGNPAIQGLPDDEVDNIMNRLIQQATPEERAKLNQMNEDGRRKMASLYMEQQSEPDSDPLDLKVKPKTIKLRGRKP